VVREIRVNLRHIEQVPDAIFRDHGKRAELSTLAKESRQVGGALRMLGLDQANELLMLCQAQIDAYANADTAVSNDDLELLAESLSSLGFYVEAVEQQRPDRDRLIVPLLRKLSGQAPALPAEDRPESVEAAVEELRNALPEIAAEVRRAPADAAARAGLRAKLADLRDDAELIGDAGLVQQAGTALKELEAGGTTGLTAAVDAIAEGGTATPAPAISEETQRLLATDQRTLDAEFLEIYLAEAAEVLDTVSEHRAQLERNPGTRDALRTVRRGFHTLKGSGRMVGLDELGELAFDVEKILNCLLEEDRAVTPSVLESIDVAERCFRSWVAELSATGRVRPDASALHAAIRAIEAELPGRREPVPKPAMPVVAPPLEPEPPPPLLEELGLAEVGRQGATAPQVTPVTEMDEMAQDDGVIEFGPAANATEIPGEPPPPAGTVAASEAEPDEITVGDVSMSASLHRILCDEADLHLAALRAELAAMQFDPRQGPSAAMVRASHTLYGINRTGGFPLLAYTAKALEQCLLGLQQASEPLPPSAYPVLARAIDALAELVARVKAREAFAGDDETEALEVQYALEALRPETEAGRAPDDAEVLAAREAARDEDVDAGGFVQAPDEATAATLAEAARREAVAAAERAAAAEAVEREAVAAAEREAAAAAEAALRLSRAEPDPLAGVRDDVDDQVFPIFLEEAVELFPEAGEALRGLRRDPADVGHARRLRRTLHTLKGSARMAGAMRLGELTHRMESRLQDGDSLVSPAAALFDLLESDLDGIAFVLDALREGRTNVPLPLFASPEAAGETLPMTAAAPVPTAPAGRSGEPGGGAVEKPVVVPFVPRAPAVAPAAAAGETIEAESGQRALLRVRADIIDRLANEAGEVAITRSRIDAELRALRANLLELTSSVIRLRAQVREIEIQGESQIQSRMSNLGQSAEGFDPLEFDRYTRFQELTRSLAESVNDVATVQQSLLKNLDDADAALLAQARYSRDIQQQLFSIRTVPFGSLSERLYRILRQTAKELDKRVNLEIRGATVELDRSVLEKLVGPLEHLLRNAVDHGIEPRAARAAAGKSETGEIALTVRQVGNEIAIEISDDGAGLDLDQIRVKAVAQGRVAGDPVPGDAQLIDCIFQPGFSTATRVTPVSGRGIGMDVVRSEVAALGGRVEVATRRGEGTTFLLYLPLTLAVAQAVLVRAGGRLWALPAPMVEQVQQIKPEALLDLYVTRSLAWQGRSYPFHYLPRLLGDTRHPPGAARHNAVLLLRAGQGYAAVHVDEMVGNQEVVVKNIGPQLARVSGIAGATVLGNGEIVLIINPVLLAQRAGFAPVAGPDAPDRVVPASYLPATTAPARGPPQILIVDDSLTVRKITSRLLSREGFAVITAKDGVDALELLEDQAPDVILLDIEMPRMDGFEFTRTIRRDSRYAQIPIIMITSRTAEKHRNLARDLGVDLYLGKPFQEEELLRNLREMLALTP
jgi:chemosensory pili system protein ChpA (sensor histidine kinase/response regulator)